MDPTTPIKPDVTLDLTGTTCPGPILGTKKMIAELAQGQVLLLLSDCPGTRDDLFSWAEHTGNAVIRTERRGDDVTGYYVQRGRAAGTGPAAQVVLDMRGSVCPGPIVEARRMLNSMPVGEVLKMVSNCPGSKADVTDWARVTGVELMAVQEIGPHEWEFFLRRVA
jgi:TusA-related sulfurtransferase